MNEWMNGVCFGVCEWGVYRSWALESKQRGDSRRKEKFERKRNLIVLELWKFCRNGARLFI